MPCEDPLDSDGFRSQVSSCSVDCFRRLIFLYSAALMCQYVPENMHPPHDFVWNHKCL